MILRINLQQLYVTPVVKTKLLAVLTSVAGSYINTLLPCCHNEVVETEIVLHRNQHKIRLRKPPKDVLEHICDASGGDVRQAVTQLQFVMLGQTNGALCCAQGENVLTCNA